MSSSDLSLETLSDDELSALDAMLVTKQLPAMDSVRPLDLTDLGATPGQGPGLELVHEAFSRLLGIEFERATRSGGYIKAVKPEVLPFSEVYARLDNPAGIILVDLDAFETTGLLVFDIELLFHFIDLIMGGPGGAGGAADLVRNRSFTPTERALVAHLVGNVSKALESAWKEIAPLTLKALRSEVDKRHAAVIPPSERVVNFVSKLQWGDISGEISLIVPYRGMRPYGRKLEHMAINSASGSADGWEDTMVGLLKQVPVTLTAVLGRAEMTLRQVMELEVGMTLRLDTDPSSTVELQVEGIPRFSVEPTSLNGNVAITLVDVIGAPSEALKEPHHG